MGMAQILATAGRSPRSAFGRSSVGDNGAVTSPASRPDAEPTAPDAEPTAPDAEPRWGLPDAVGSLAGFVAVSLLVSYLGARFLDIDPAGVAILALLAGWVVLGGWPLLAARRRGRGPRRDFRLSARPIDLGLGVLAAVSVLVLGLIYAVVLLLTTGEVPPAAVAEVAAGADPVWLAVLAVLVAVGAPLVEEIHFRGLWWGALRRRGLGPWPTLVVTAVLFAVIHGELLRLPVLVVAGLAIGYVRMVTDRLGPAVVAHIAINTLGAIGLLASA
jgi:membrane protease YdiL (CAAX protease family)